MKKIGLFIIALVALVACNKSTNYTLKGTIVPDQDGNIVLYEFDEGNPVPADTAEIVDGKFTFNGEIEFPELRLLGLEGSDDYIAQLFLEDGSIDMTVYPDSMQGNEVLGSESNELFDSYIDEMVIFQEDENALRERFMKARTQGDEEETKSIMAEYEVIRDNSQLFAKNFIKEYSSSPVAAYVYIMNFYREADATELDSVLQMFDPSIKESEFVGIIQKRYDELKGAEEGAVAPDFTLKKPNGDEFTLSSLKGKYVLIDFWASWCQPCMREMPNVIEQYKKYGGNDFEIIGISLDREKEAWLKTIEQLEMDWVHVWGMQDGQGEVASKYGVTGIPHTVLLDKDGKIIDKNLRGDALGEKLSELLD